MSDSIKHLEELIGQGRYMECRTLCEKVKNQDQSLRLSQLYALSLSKSGAVKQAQEYLEPIYQKSPEDIESAGILGGIYKELFRISQDSSYAVRSRDTYLKNFEATKNYYTGINAATMSAIAGQMRKGREIAAEVLNVISPTSSEFWELCTLAEAHLLLKNKQQSTDLYFKARDAAQSDWGKIRSVYNQLWLINHYTSVPKEVMKTFSPPAVAAFVGHMIDLPGRAKPRFPADIETQIKIAIKSLLQTQNIRIGYSSLACGGDILFAEAIEEMNGEVNISLPFCVPDFLDISVRFAGDSWVDRFSRLVEKYPATMITDESYGGYDDLFSFQSKIIYGSAVLRSVAQHAEPKLITVLSEADLKRKEGGTRDTLRLWPFPTHHINISPDLYVTPRAAEPSSFQLPVFKITQERPVMYLIAFDFQETNVLEKDKFKEAIRNETESELTVCKAVKEDGDVCLLAYESESGAIDFLVHLNDVKHDTWTKSKLKLVLHAGPVYINGNDLKGENVDRIYEMCGVIPRATICASDHIAAVLALDQKRFSVDYAGMLSSQNHHHSIYTVSFNLMKS